MNFEKFAKARNIGAQFLHEYVQELYGLGGAGSFVHKAEAQHQFIDAMDDIIAGDGFRLPGLEGPLARGGRTKKAAAAEAGRRMDPAGDEAALRESLQRGINGPRAVAERAHRSAGKNLSQVIARARLLVEQAQQSVAEKRIFLHSTLRIITRRIIKNKQGIMSLTCATNPAEAVGGQRRLLKFAAGGGLLEADVAGGDFGFEIVFALHRGAGESAEHGDLADVRQRVGNGALEEAFVRTVQWFV